MTEINLSHFSDTNTPLIIADMIRTMSEIIIQTWAFLVLARAAKLKILARPARQRPKNPDFGAPRAPKMGKNSKFCTI